MLVGIRINDENTPSTEINPEYVEGITWEDPKNFGVEWGGVTIHMKSGLTFDFKYRTQAQKEKLQNQFQELRRQNA